MGEVGIYLALGVEAGASGALAKKIVRAHGEEEP